jgi:hypothetical protein
MGHQTEARIVVRWDCRFDTAFLLPDLSPSRMAGFFASVRPADLVFYREIRSPLHSRRVPGHYWIIRAVDQ